MGQSTDEIGTEVSLDELRELLARPAAAPVALALEFVAPDETADAQHSGKAALLPEGHVWRDPVTGTPRVPLQLCEYLAYRTSLAYETKDRIETYLTRCCEGVDLFEFFDSRNDQRFASTHSQGYAFRHEGKAFLIFRGTEGLDDWSFNLADAQTDSFTNPNDRRLRKLRSRFRDVEAIVGDKEPGRHMGFALAWGVLRDQVEAWLKRVEAASGGPIPIVCSGHSLGGAIALLCAFELARKRGPDAIAAVITFGAPDVGAVEFAQVYDRLIGERTVRLESTGDLVPAIMRRWYYCYLYELRHWAKSAFTLEKSASFKSVGQGWSFAQEPPLEPGDIELAILSMKRAAEEAIREAEKRKGEAEAASARPATAGAAAPQGGAAPAAPKAPTTTPTIVTAAPGPDAPSASPQASPPAGSDGGTKAVQGSADATPAGSGSKVVVWVVFGVFIVAGTLIAWYFIRRKLFAHDVQQRYALYLNTLAYQQLRQRYGGDLTKANAALDEHLLRVRGDLSKAPGKYFDIVAKLPVRLEPSRQDPDYLAYLKEKSTFV
ncbi:MAG: hypothetical protein NW205_12015 [Hyphomicrobiaceae bacterium]|nr:hypothetical protein [Hyphomicrobiaceae bacterium]